MALFHRQGLAYWAIVQLGHLSNFYKRALEKTLLGCILRQNKGTDIFLDQSVQVSFIWNSSDLHFSLGLGLSLVCGTGGLLLK